MRRLAHGLALVLAVALAAALPAPLAAQTEDADRSFLEGLLEDNLSGAGRDVRIRGFSGALSSEAQIDEMTISDATGNWLTMRNIVLSWDRGALLGGEIDIERLSAEEIVVARLPVAEATEPLPSPEATPFALPELPVSVQIDLLKVDRVVLGAPLLGEEIALGVEGSTALSGGEGTAKLTIDRLGPRPGQFALDTAYSNASRVLKLALSLQENAGGIAATLLDLPGAPSVRLVIEGDAPIDDFVAQIRLATDGEDRLSGSVATRLQPAPGADAEDPAAPRDRVLSVDVEGDVAPVFAPQLRPFFGPQISLRADAVAEADGTLRLDGLDLAARAISLSGRAELGPDRWPRRLELQGTLRDPAGGPVILPLPGAETRVDSADLRLFQDAEAGDGWRLTADMRGFARPDLQVSDVILAINGTLERGEALAPGRVTGDVTLSATGIGARDPALAQAIGDRLIGALEVDWRQGVPVQIRDIALAGADYGLSGEATITQPSEGVDLAASAKLTLEAEELARFGPLAGQNLGGAARLRIDGTAQLLSGAFDGSVEGTGTNLRVGIAQVDALLEGDTTLDLSAARDEDGLRLRDMSVESDHVRIAGRATLAQDGSRAELDVALPDTARALPGLPGASDVAVTAQQDGTNWAVTLTGQMPGEARVDLDGTISLAQPENPVVQGRLAAEVGRLATYSSLAGASIGGAAQLSIEGSGQPVSGFFDITLDATTRDLTTGVNEADRLLEGPAKLALTAFRDDDVIRIEALDLQSDHAQIAGNGLYAEKGSRADLTARLTDTARVLPQLSGAADVTVTARQNDTQWDVTLKGALPGAATVDLAAGIDLEDPDAPGVKGRLDARIGQLAAYSRLAGRRLGGAADLSVTGSGRPAAQVFDVSGTLDGRDLRFGIPALAPILDGASRLVFDVAGPGDGSVTIREADLRTPQLSAEVSGRASPDDADLRFDARLANLGVFSPDLAGPATVTGTARRSGAGPFVIDTDGTGPGGSALRVRGSIAPDGPVMNLAITGAAPLALINRQIRPRALAGRAAFDLRLDGRPGLDALSGTVRTDGARLALPLQRLTLEDITADVQLGGGRAQIAAEARLSTGGRLRASGPVTLSAPFPADLAIALRDLTVSDPDLYDATLGGDLTLSGPLTRGPALGGVINFDTVELRIPQGGGLSFGDLPGLEHRNAPADVQRTLRFAGRLNTAAAGTPAPPLPVDLRINAPARIFVRGRGLTAELGGALRLRGTLSDLVPQGQVDLIRGTLDLLGRRLTLDEGSIVLRGSLVPYVRFVATSEVEGILLNLALEGVASEPELTLSSTPELPEEEILSFFLFGRNVTDISALQAIRLASAIRTLSGKGGTGLTEQLREGAGVDTLDITTDEDGTAEARVGKYLSDNIYSDVAVNAEGETEINLNLQVTPNVTVRGRLGSDGDTGLGIFIEKDY